jgi:hypothetical protein
MVPKGNDKLRAEINRALADMEGDGTQRRLLLKWLAITKLRKVDDSSNVAWQNEGERKIAQKSSGAGETVTAAEIPRDGWLARTAVAPLFSREPE